MKIKQLILTLRSMWRPIRLADLAELSAHSSASLDLFLRKYLIYTSLERSLKIIRGNFLAFSALTLLFQTPLFMYSYYRSQNGNAEENIDVLASIGLISIGILLFFINISTLVYGTICELTDRHAGFRKCVIYGLKQTLPVTGTIFIVTGAWLIGFAILILPAFIIITILWLAIPTSIIEETKMLASLKRSIYLTERYRSQIFVTIMILALLHFQAQIISDYQNDYPFLISLVGFLAGSFIILVQGVLCTVFYYNVQIIKEGPAQEKARERIARRIRVGAGLPPTDADI